MKVKMYYWWSVRVRASKPDKAGSDKTEGLGVSVVRDALLVLSKRQLDRELEVVENNEAGLISLLLLLEGAVRLYHGYAQDGGEMWLVVAGDRQGKFEIFLALLRAEHRGEARELVIQQQQISSE